MCGKCDSRRLLTFKANMAPGNDFFLLERVDLIFPTRFSFERSKIRIEFSLI